MANVLFKRLEDSSELDNIPIVDGSLYITKDGKTVIDYDDDRIPIGGTPDDEMSDRSSNTVENKVIKGYVDGFIATINDGFVYSTNEVNTGKKWIDNKYIYRRVIQTTNAQCVNDGILASKDVSTSGYNIDFMVNVSLILKTPTFVGYNWVFAANDTSKSTRLYYDYPNNNIVLRNSNSAYNNSTIYLILEYTKSTD